MTTALPTEAGAVRRMDPRTLLVGLAAMVQDVLGPDFLKPKKDDHHRVYRAIHEQTNGQLSVGYQESKGNIIEDMLNVLRKRYGEDLDMARLVLAIRYAGVLLYLKRQGKDGTPREMARVLNLREDELAALELQATIARIATDCTVLFVGNMASHIVASAFGRVAQTGDLKGLEIMARFNEDLRGRDPNEALPMHKRSDLSNFSEAELIEMRDRLREKTGDAPKNIDAKIIQLEEIRAERDRSSCGEEESSDDNGPDDSAA